MPSGKLAMTRGSGVVVSNFDGTGMRTYSGVSGAWQYGLRPNWAASGTRILVHGGGSDGVRLRSIDVATGGVTTLPTTAALAGQYYPDATRNWIYFSAEVAAGSYRVWRMRPDGSALAQAPGTTPSYTNYYRPSLSPDSSKLVVSVIEGTIGVRVFDAVTGAAISPFIASATSPRWSPDGQWIAYSTPGGGALRVMRADGSQARTVSSLYFDEWFDWSNDGQWLVAQVDRRIALVRVSDAHLVPLAFTYDAWQPAVQR